MRDVFRAANGYWMPILVLVRASISRKLPMRIRQLGVQRILYGSDAATVGNLPPKEGWAAFRQIPLTDEEFTAIANNLSPYQW